MSKKTTTTTTITEKYDSNGNLSEVHTVIVEEEIASPSIYPVKSIPTWPYPYITYGTDTAVAEPGEFYTINNGEVPPGVNA